MKFRILIFGIGLLCLAACKKDTTANSSTTGGTFKFDIAGVHRSFKVPQLKLEIDSSPAKQKVLNIITGDTALPQVRFSITDGTFAYNTNYFVTGTYPPLIADTACADTGKISYCLGFFMVYTDTGAGQVGTFAANDSLSLLTVVSSSGS